MVLLDISSWWQGMDFFAKIFWAIALLFSLLFLVQLVISFAGGDGSEATGDADDYVSGDDGIGYQFFTIRNMIAFFTFFGWAGVAGISGGLNKGLTIAIAVVAGSVVVVMMAFLFRSMSKLKQSGTLQLKNAVGVIAETYLFIPASRGGFGKVHVKVQGSLHELQAITDDAEQIATGKLVKVTGIINDSVLLVTSSLS
ncbi:hypothetical protein [Lacibacter sp. H407]|uniref:hypothetical protein n=1 Tax=Lacibacter sp. H407 TaxID=3133423 RepID=UPI0030BACBAC